MFTHSFTLLQEKTGCARGFRLTVFLLLLILFGTGVRQTNAQESSTGNENIVIDCTKEYHPISPYIYGQFIEHLGRCIYGGIWSEMLQDRKFYLSPGTKDSPWFVVYDCNIRMVKENPFVGEHTPEAYCQENRWIGLAQKNLAFQKGKKYQGYAWIKPSRGIDRVDIHFHYLVDGKDQSTVFTQKPVFDKYTKFTFEIEAPVTDNDVKIEVAAKGIGTLQVGTVSVMPADNIHGMRPDTLACLKELNAPIYRWPGGNFVSGYNWQDGIGDRDKRPPRKNPAWTGIEHNDFGLDEFMFFCRYLQTEPYIAVNTGAGNIENALSELEYVNGSSDTPMGKIRMKNGHKDPYNVHWWGLGNEMYGDWQIGHLTVDKYIVKNNEFAKKFHAKDASIVLVGVGNVGKWDEAFIPGAFDSIDYLSEHFYVQKKDNIEEHVSLPAQSIQRITEAHRNYAKRWPNLYAKKKQPIAMDEWNYWYGPHLFGELGTRYFMKDGLGIAKGLHAFYRASDLYIMANYAQTVNVIGAIKTNRTTVQMETTGLVLTLYRNQFGSIPVQCALTSKNNSPLDISAALTADRKILTLAIVNPTGKSVSMNLDANKTGIETAGTLFTIADPKNDPNAFNDPGTKQRIVIKKSDLKLVNGTFKIAPLSVNLIRFPVKEK